MVIKRHLYNSKGEYKLYEEGTKEYNQAIKAGHCLTKKEAMGKKKSTKKTSPSLLDSKGTKDAK